MRLGSLPVGAKLIDPYASISFLVAAQNQPGYEGTTLLSEKIVRVAPFDGCEPVNPRQRRVENIREYGGNDFSQSNICQWLNARGPYWYKPAHQWDAPPTPENIRNGSNDYFNSPGFLSNLSESLLNNLLTTSVPLIKKVEDGTFEIKTFQAKVFLPSRAEIGMGSEGGFEEGVFLPIFRDFRIKIPKLSQDAYQLYNSPWHSAFFGPNANWRWWLRTPHPVYAYLVRYVGDMGGLSYAPAFSDIVGVRPMMNVNSNLVVSDKGEDGNIYRLI